MAKLVKLNLPDAYVCHEAFCSILAACPNLQFFSYVQAAEYGPDLEFTPSKAGRALVRSTPNLTFSSLTSLFKLPYQSLQSKQRSAQLSKPRARHKAAQTRLKIMIRQRHKHRMLIHLQLRHPRALDAKRNPR